MKSTFAGDSLRFEFHLAPPLLARHDPATGEPKKISFGPWMLQVFRVLAKFKFLRGTPFDIFGYNKDRRVERELIVGYEKDVQTVLRLLSPLTLDIAIEILSLPDQIRGYGPVKDKSIETAKARYAQLAKDLANPPPLVTPQIAAE